MDRHHIHADRTVEDPTIIRPCLHQQRECRHLCGTIIDIQAEQILLKDQTRHIPQHIAAFKVDFFEQVVGFHQDMTRPAGGIEEGDFLGVQFLWRDRGEFRLHLIGLFGWLDVEFHFRPDARLRIGRQPLGTECVLDHVFHDPIGREKLSCGRNILGLHYLADDLILLLRDVELVEPPDDLDFLPIRFLYLVDHLANDGIRVQQVVWQQKFGFVVNSLEQEGHGGIQCIALCHQQHSIEIPLFGPIELQLDDLFLVQTRQIKVLGMFDDFRRCLAFRMAQNSVAMVEVAVDLHIADGGKAVEPRVGGFLHHLLEPTVFDP
ncbi:hypothetical protein H261_17768 [Paramagnetospirillum caucaseum]|uniref:Uncharacterized protein n=1 Tax=Paramagnetospirillum caucaseum TaxID=1244869 RepID=M3A7X6_9PROT|nr:hypothetical protein H261_17768 [Paramagnetospirillum caucaseum]